MDSGTNPHVEPPADPPVDAAADPLADDLVGQARRLVRDRFPEALGAVLGGSAATGRAGPLSDLDLAVLVPGTAGAHRETVRYEGRIAELFVHTGTGLAELFAADRASRRPVLPYLYAEGLVLLDREGAAGEARARAVALLDEGPPPLPAPSVETRRYGLTDALDDLADADGRAGRDGRGGREDRHERLALGGYVLGAAAELLCDHRRAWTGGGKWLPRRLRAADPERGTALLDAHLRLCADDEAAPLVEAGGAVLDLVGGPLREGYRRVWEGTIESLAERPGG
ncbi:nucleotidyltransferase domain-containing protein [Streptomyces sp. SPB074]|uniref:nucleotidyltransferase domain-containing protein n=1 Tax=Streptomyces sp. (strain SPB074) TaxID=465543 RepID=UPI00017F0EFF|nr:nucleotidyltransferase domain-containing protein [Streptomyces sp. SPB074]EDY46429.2 nucleotidyltransferase domain-containing protein [Streptomyces sp. SPB074]